MTRDGVRHARGAAASEVAPGVGSQTLSRGIQVLEVLADAGSPLRIDDVAAKLGLHRSVAYRLIRTLEAHGLVGRTQAGQLTLGAGLAALASRVEVDLQAVARPELMRAAEELRLTCFLAVLDRTECVTLASAEPPREVAVVAQRPGTRHSVAMGATGKTILSMLPSGQWPVEETEQLRSQVDVVARRGWAHTRDEVIPGMIAIAVPADLGHGRLGAVAALYVGAAVDDAAVAHRLMEATRNIVELTQKG